MAVKFQIALSDTATGPIYFQIRDTEGQIYNGSTFETYATGNIATYDMQMTEQGTASRYYAATFPTIAAGTYFICTLMQVNGTPGTVSEADALIDGTTWDWDGTELVSLSLLTGVTTLLARLTATRAGYLDNLSAGVPTVAAIADQVWDEVLSGHLTGGTTGAALNGAGAAGDPWGTTLPGAYSAGSAGYIIGNNVNAAIDSRASQTSVNTIDGIVDDILVDTAVIGAAGAGLTAIPWNAAWDAEVQSEVDDALIAQNLDHLVKVAVDTDFATTVHLNSVIGQLVDNGTSATFDRTTDSLEAIRDRGDASWITATGFSTHTASDVWAVGTRLLTAGTNIVLAKGTGVTGFNDIAATAVVSGGAITTSGGAVSVVTTTTNLTNLPVIPTDWLTAAGVKADAVTKIQNGLATSASLTTVEGKIDTIDGIVDSILLDTLEILVDTAEIGAAGAGLTEAGGTGDQFTAVPWNATWDAEVQSEVDDALVAQNLDHLVKIAVDTDFATTVHLNSVIGQLADNGTSATFDRTTDSLEALRDRGDATWITATGFSTHSASDVWAVGTRLLTAGTNIVLAKGTGVTGFNDIAATAVVSGGAITTSGGAVSTVTTLTNLPAIPIDWLTAAGVKADAVTKIQNGLATSSALTTVEGKIDTIDGIVDSILVDTAEIGAAGAGLTALASASNLATANIALAKLDDTVEDNGGVYRFTAAALAEAPTGGSAPTAGEIATEVWSTSVRTLTAGTNIVLAKGTGITGFNDLSAAQVNAEADTALADYDAPTNTEMSAAFTQIKGATWTTTDTLEAIRDRGDVAWVTASGFSTHSASDVWAVGTRLLTAGTNIVLAKGTGVTGFNDIAATAVVSGGAITTSGGAVSTVTNLTNLPVVPVDWLTAAGVKADAVTKIQNGLATSSALTTVEGKIDTIDGIVDSILVDTGEIGVAGAGLTALASASNLATANIALAKLDDTVEDNGGTYRFTSAALAEAPTGGSAPTAGEIATEVWGASVRTLSAGTNIVLAKGTGVTGFNDLSASQVNAEVDTAISDYDPPTNAEMLAAFTQIKGATWSVTDTLEAIRDRGDVAWTTATGFSTHTASDVWAVGTRLLSAGTNIVLAKGTGITGFNDLSAAQMNSEVATALLSYDPPTSAEMTAAFTQIKGVTWTTTDTLEAIRDRGDAAWLTATGFSTHTASDVWLAGTRTLSSGANISLAKGTGVTGFNDIAATAIVSGGAITTSGGAVVTVVNLSNLPAAPVDWLSGDAVSDNAVGKIQAGLTTSAMLDDSTDEILTAISSVAAVDVQAISDRVLADMATTHGTGSYQTAIVSGLAAETTLLSLPSTIAVVLADEHGEGPWTESSDSGDGSVVVDHDYGGIDNLAIVAVGTNARVNRASIRVFLEDDWNSGRKSPAYVLGSTSTNTYGRWKNAILLDPGSYVMVTAYPGQIETQITQLRVT